MTTRSLTIYEAIRPSSRILELPLLLGFNLLLIASAWVSFGLPFSPVPVTGQTFGVLLVAMALGRVRGTAVVGAYLLEGTAGLPVFALGSGGLPVLFGPTGGYLLGFLAAAWVAGSLADRGWHRSLWQSITAMTIGTAVIFAVGLAWLSRFVPAGALLAVGLTPFLIGAGVKIAVASAILPAVWRLVGRSK
jgi:biotin transport system substrate-specific component